MILLLTALTVLGCDGEAKDSTEEAVPAQPAASTPKTDDAPEAKPSTPAPSASAAMGLKCVKTAINIESTVYMGVVQRDGTAVTAIRTDKTSPGLDAAQAKVLPTSFEFDDGETHETFVWYGEKGKAGMKGKTAESAYPPGDIEMTYQMARRTRGDCSEWTIDEDFLLLPKDANFDTELEDVVDGLAKPK